MNEALEPIKGPPDPLSILDKLAERGADAGQLEQLVNLHLKLRAADAEQAFNDAMVRCQEEMPLVVKASENTFTHNKYANLESIQTVAKPVYSRNGFALNFAEDDCQAPGMKRTVCDVRHKQGHCVRYHLDLALDGEGAKGGANMNAVQAGVSTGTYGQRVLLCRIFNITIAGTDKDGSNLDDMTFIDEEQVNELDMLIAQQKLDREKFLKWQKVESLDKLTQKQFKHVVATYRQRRGGAS